MRRKLLYAFAAVSLATLCCFASGKLVTDYVFLVVNRSASPDEMIYQHTQAILQAVSASNATPSPILSETANCGDWLPALLQKYKNDYTITIGGIWGDDASPFPGGTGTTTGTVFIDFPDSNRVEMQFYAYTLNTCRLIPTPKHGA